MPIILCEHRINCEGVDSPVSNYSAEAPDLFDFRYFWWVYWNPNYPLPPDLRGHSDPPIYWAQGCESICLSLTSQADAAACAQRQAYLCGSGHEEDDGGTVTLFSNAAQTCTGLCQDGSPFTYVVPAGWIVTNNQSLSDSAARALACALANNQMVCLSSLTDGCLGQAYSELTAVTKGLPPFTISLFSGTLPPGLSLAQVDETSALLSGTPTTPGNFIFRIQARSASGPQLIKTYQVAIIGITNFGSAPTPTNGTAYSFQLAVAGGTAPYTFSLVSGALPDGLTLSSTGLISGTPTTTGTFNFTIGLHDSSSNAALCQKTAALTVASNNCPDFAGKNWKDPGWYSEANSGGGILTTTFTPIPSGISFDLNAISPNSLVDTCGALSQPSFPLTPGTTCNCRAVFQCTLVGPVNERCLSFVISADAGGPYVNVALSTSAPGVYNFDIPFTLDPLATTMTVQMQVQAYCGAAGFGPMDQSRLTGTLVNV